MISYTYRGTNSWRGMNSFNVMVGLSNIGSFVIAVWLAKPLWENAVPEWNWSAYAGVGFLYS